MDSARSCKRLGRSVQVSAAIRMTFPRFSFFPSQLNHQQALKLEPFSECKFSEGRIIPARITQTRFFRGKLNCTFLRVSGKLERDLLLGRASEWQKVVVSRKLVLCHLARIRSGLDENFKGAGVDPSDIRAGGY